MPIAFVGKNVAKIAIAGGIILGAVYLARRYNVGSSIVSGLRGFGESVGQSVTAPFQGLLSGLTTGGQGLGEQAQALSEGFQRSVSSVFGGGFNVFSEFGQRLDDIQDDINARNTNQASNDGAVHKNDGIFQTPNYETEGRRVLPGSVGGISRQEAADQGAIGFFDIPSYFPDRVDFLPLTQEALNYYEERGIYPTLTGEIYG